MDGYMQDIILSSDGWIKIQSLIEMIGRLDGQIRACRGGCRLNAL